MIRCLVFDWGDTVMETYPEYSGAMVDWPKAAAVAGIPEALNELKDTYRLVIGTNARDSNAGQIRSALDRVGIGQYFSDIFTFSEIKARKPDAAFFKNIQAKLGLDSEELMMIGDSYEVDILGAWQTGWRSAWYNPMKIPCPGHLPVHEIELHTMFDLSGLLIEPELPTLKTCLEWIQSNQASGNLLIHVQMVAACAYQMALWLNQNDIPANPILAHRGGLLHDLAKLWPQKQVDHGLAASLWLKEKGQFQLAEIASRHMLFEILHEERRPRSWEEKLVYLADKLIEKNTIVSIEERIAGLKTRYIMAPELLAQTYPLLENLQKEICQAVRIDPQQLPEKLTGAIYKN